MGQHGILRFRQRDIRNGGAKHWWGAADSGEPPRLDDEIVISVAAGVDDATCIADTTVASAFDTWLVTAITTCRTTPYLNRDAARDCDATRHDSE